ncbi:MAG: hypothetical protein DMG38_29330 [Acidobacteria bacterium]|nr:MAG: hypothetical protein DMG38_29330 [Acidobacteriota bacterium]
MERCESRYRPGVCKRFFLCCVDGEKKREFFTDSKLLHLRQCADNFQIRSSPNWLLIFRPGGIIGAKNEVNVEERTRSQSNSSSLQRERLS